MRYEQQIKRAQREKHELALFSQLRALGVERPVREFRFGAEAAGGPGRGLRARLDEHGLKDWRFDFAWPELRFAVEVEGGIHTNGRHTRGAGYEEDLKKYHHAMRLGWTVYRCGAHLIKTGEAATLIARLIQELSD